MNTKDIINKDRAAFENVMRRAFNEIRLARTERCLFQLAEMVRRLAILAGRNGHSEQVEDLYESATRRINSLNGGHKPQESDALMTTVACNEEDGAALSVYDEYAVEDGAIEEIKRPLIIANEDDFGKFIREKGYNVYTDDAAYLAYRYTQELLKK